MQAMREDKVKVVLEVRKEPNVTYIEGYNGTLLDPNKVGEEEAGDIDDDDDNEIGADELTEKDMENVVSDDENRVIIDDDDDEDDAQFGGGPPASSNSDSFSSVSSPSDLSPENSRSKISSSGSSSNGSKKSKKKKSLELSLTCTTENAKPPVTHHWSKIIGDKKEKLTPVTSQIIQVDEITGVTTTKSTVRLNLSPRDKVSCCWRNDKVYGSTWQL